MAVITDRALQAKAHDKDTWLDDPAPRGHGRFCARITPAGKRLFYFRYTGADNKRVRLPIGGYDSNGIGGLTLKSARAKAGKLSQLYQGGVRDIKGHLEAERKVEEARLETERLLSERAATRMTIEGLFEKWVVAQLSRRKDGGKEVVRSFKKDVLPVLGSMYADKVRKGHIAEVVDSILARGANRLARMVFASMRQMFKWAVYRDWLDVDPTAKIRKADIGTRDTERDRVLSNEELRQLTTQVPSAGLLPTTEAAVWICLSTCCRIGEFLNARWEHVDLERKVWTIPADNAKNNQTLEISLSVFALSQFEIIQRHHSDSEWLFPNRKKTGPVCNKTITKQLSDRQRTEALSNRTQNTGTLVLSGGRWTPHDLRRTGATLMAGLGVAPEVIERCLNHVEQNKVRRIYQRYSYSLEMAQAWKLLGERLESLTGGESAVKIIPIRKSGTE